MIPELPIQIGAFLRNSGFDVTEANAPFSLVAQNTSVLVFIIVVQDDLGEAVRTVTTLLSAPFHTKKFGPKTMEMYCIFAVDENTPISAIERWEQDLKFCRKIFVTHPRQLEARLSFLRQLGSGLIGSFDISALFWSQMEKRLDLAETELMKSFDTSVRTAEELLSSLSRRK
jgi:hypothetical protein